MDQDAELKSIEMLAAILKWASLYNKRMQKSALRYALVLSGALFPFLLLAHGGFEKSVGNVTVDINQVPISPFTGENVQFYLSLRDTGIQIQKSLNEQAMPNWPVSLSLVKTTEGDASKDTTILTKQFTTDVNSSFDFSYTFPDERYYDIELTFTDPKTQQPETTGFLVQPRNASPLNLTSILSLGALVFLFGILIGVRFSFHKDRYTLS